MVLKVIWVLLGVGCSLQSFFWAGQVAGAWVGWWSDPVLSRDWMILVCGGNGFFMMDRAIESAERAFPSLRQILN